MEPVHDELIELNKNLVSLCAELLTTIKAQGYVSDAILRSFSEETLLKVAAALHSQAEEPELLEPDLSRRLLALQLFYKAIDGGEPKPPGDLLRLIPGGKNNP